MHCSMYICLHMRALYWILLNQMYIDVNTHVTTHAHVNTHVAAHTEYIKMRSCTHGIYMNAYVLHM